MPLRSFLLSEPICPHCGYRQIETMPTDARIYFHQCAGCNTTLRRKSGDCCVFCSCGSAPCPPVQAAKPLVSHIDPTMIWPHDHIRAVSSNYVYRAQPVPYDWIPVGIPHTEKAVAAPSIGAFRVTAAH
jgi:hypothetical protein